MRMPRQGCPAYLTSPAAGEAPPAATGPSGVKVAVSRVRPFAGREGITASGFSQGAPMRRNGVSDPRPSDTFVPSISAVPGYTRAASGERRFGEGATQARPVSAQTMVRFHPFMGTTVSFAGLLRDA